ncbi:MAG: SoxR reducing system RseC family protein [Bacteroidota bacterium]
MSDRNLIDHEGTIDRIEDGVAHVKITSESACAACHAKGVCSAADQEEKFLDIPLKEISYNNGESVRVQVTRHLGFKAVALGYFYPFLLLMAVLIVLIISGVSELKAGSLALLSLIPYYLLLYAFRKRIESTFTFSIKKTNTVQ